MALISFTCACFSPFKLSVGEGLFSPAILGYLFVHDLMHLYDYPRRACAARVTVVGSVCLSVCLSVSVTFDLPSRMSNRAINTRAY